MSEEQESIVPESPNGELSEEAAKVKPAKKVAKKAAKKATKKAAKKAVKKVAKKAAKKVVKKVTGKAAGKEVEASAELDLGLEMDSPHEESDVLAKAAAAELAAIKAAKLAAKAAAKARLAAEEAAARLAAAKLAAEANMEKAPAESIEKDQAVTAEKGDESEEGGDSDTPTEIVTIMVDEGESKRAKREERPKKETPPPPPPPEVPDEIDFNEFRNEPLANLYDEVERLPVRIPNQVTCAHLAFTVLSCYAKFGTRIVGEGILEFANGNFAMLRDEMRSFRNSPDDLYVPAEILRDYDLREGQRLKVTVRAPGHRDQFMGVAEVLEIDGQPVANYVPPRHFDELTSLFPEERFVLEGDDDGAGLATRVVDLVAPLGKGQRGLIVAPPRGGKTILLKQIAKAIQRNHPEAELVVLLLDERPEEVTDFEDMIGRNVFASTFDEPSTRHAQVASLVLERSRRLVEQGKDVVILLDSLTRLARGYNNAVRGGPIGSGGVSPRAITDTRKFFGAARNVEEGGSLTILATCLIETESRMDDVIFEELKGTGNMEVRLDRELAEQRIYPAIHIPQSGTRNDDRLYHREELPRVQEIRRHLASLPIGEAIETLLRNLARTKSNTELLLQGMR